MEQELPDTAIQDDAGADEAPAVVLPSPNTQGVTGGLQGVASGIPAISPQPFVAPAGGQSSGLASRIEDALADDGRFTSFLSEIHITETDGAVQVLGMVPSDGQRRSLLAAIRSISGVTAVQDGLHVG